MALKETGAVDVPDVTRWQGGFSWVAHPDEGLQRASHALSSEDGNWLIDPIDFDGLGDRLPGVEGLYGVCILTPRHRRDAEAIARRHDLPVHIPAWMSGAADKLSGPVERFDETLPNTEFRTLTLYDRRFWRECALFDGETLIVPEALGTAFHYRLPQDQLGVHPFLRPVPPREQLQGLDPERVLTGHGVGTFLNGTAALRDALSTGRTRAPLVYLHALRELLGR